MATTELLKQQVVDSTIQAFGGLDATREVRTDDLIRLRQALHDLCLASGSWSRALEAVYQADIAALRELGGIGSAESGEL